LGALQRRLEAVEDRTGVRTRLRAHDFHRLPSGVEEGLYRVAQEALNNTLKHSGATQVSVEIKSQGEYVALEVSDNGCGFELNLGDGHGGMGLRGMLERTQKMGGKLSVVSAPGQGTTVTAVVLADAPVTHPFSFAPA
jgi:signal transduction histidine kinase